MIDNAFWMARALAPAAITFAQTATTGVAIIAPLRVLSVAEQNAAGQAFVKFHARVRAMCDLAIETACAESVPPSRATSDSDAGNPRCPTFPQARE